MKKSFVAFAFAAFAFGACTTKPNPVTVSLSATSSTEIGLTSTAKQVSLTVNNSSAQSATIQWERTETTSVAGWTYLVNGGSAASGTLTIAAGATITVSLVINANGNAGMGTGNIKFYDAADQSATTKTFNYSYSTVSSYFTLSPVGSMTRTIKAIDPNEDYHVWIKNPNTVPLNVTWRKTGESANPSNWTVAVCTLPACFTPTVFTEVTTVPAGDSIEYKATINHDGTGGTGGMTCLFFIASDSANSVMSQAHLETVNP